MKGRLLTALLVGGTVFGTVLGLSASLPVTSKDLGSGSDQVASCDPDGISVDYDLTPPTSLTGVTITDVASSCAGQTAHVALVDGTTTIATGSGDVEGSSVTVNTVPDVSAAAVDNVIVTISG